MDIEIFRKRMTFDGEGLENFWRLLDNGKKGALLLLAPSWKLGDDGPLFKETLNDERGTPSGYKDEKPAAKKTRDRGIHLPLFTVRWRSEASRTETHLSQGWGQGAAYELPILGRRDCSGDVGLEPSRRILLCTNSLSGWKAESFRQ